MKNKLTQKKIVAIFLTAMMCLNLLPTLAMADTTQIVEPSAITQEEGSTHTGASHGEGVRPEENPDFSQALNDGEAIEPPEELKLEETEKPSADIELEPEENQPEELPMLFNHLLDMEQDLTVQDVQADGVWDGQTATKPAEDENGVYQIANGENLAWFAKLVNGTLPGGTPKNAGAKAVLLNDIVLGDDSNKTNWTPIGNSSNKYVGSFDGQGHTIRGLGIETTAANQGLFGYIGSTGGVRGVTVEGKISAGNQTGGIVGWNEGAIENCGNKASITSTQKNVGGIAGNNYGATASPYAAITGCYNIGSISARSDAGGIAGQNRLGNISSCYNLGKVESTNTSAPNTGGLVGYGYTGKISNSYNLGAVQSAGTSNIGAVVGFLYQPGTSGILEKTYYLEGTYAKNVGNTTNEHTVVNDNAVAKSSEAMKTDGFLADLGGSFVSDTTPSQNSGYPILGWQDPHAKYTVIFSLNEDEAEVVVRDSGGELVTAETEGIYKLNNGTYTYVVSKDEFQTAEGSFSINNGGKTIDVTLKAKTYPVTFAGIEPAGSILTVSDAKGVVIAGNGLAYQLPKGTYTYVVDKFGYQKVEGSFNVTGAEITIPKVILAEAARSLATFDISFIDNNLNAVGVITVKHGDEIQERGKDGSYQLADGDYTYSVSCNGYESIIGSFSMKGEAIHIQKTMELQKVWSGASQEPSTIIREGKVYYQIVTGENLAWFSSYVKGGNLTANAVVMGNILLSNQEKDNTWTSIGSYTTQYGGSFDGQGFKITGLKGTNGLFAYSSSSSVIQNVSVEGVVTKATSNVGGIMGVNAGIIRNCAFRGSIVAGSTEDSSGGQRVGGIAGNNTGSIEDCINYASIKAATKAFATDLGAGGIAGQSSGTLKNCYNSGTVSGYCQGVNNGKLGGITGETTGTIENCYNIGLITKEMDTMGKVGALAGSSAGAAGSMGNCYYLTGSFSTGLGNGTGDVTPKTAEEMKDELFVTILGDAFNQDYAGGQAINSGYPVLKWQGGQEVGGNANVEAVAADRTALQLNSLVIKDAGMLGLPTGGAHGTTISWSSSNTDILSNAGLVTLPLSGNVHVILTATIKKGSVSDTKPFEVIVKSLDESTVDYLTAASNSLSGLLRPVFGTDTNIIEIVQDKLDAMGYSDITVTLIDNADERYIASNGDITYFYVDPSENNVLNFAQVNNIEFNLSKGDKSVPYKTKANIRWDADKVTQAITEQIANNLTFDRIKGENTDSNAITTNLSLPQQIAGKAWATISWQSDSSYVSLVKKSSELFGDFTGEITRPQKDTAVTLTAAITFNKTGSVSEEAPIVVTKQLNIVLKGDDFDWTSYMQNQLDEKYTIDRLKVFSSNKSIDPENVTEDIQLLVPRNVGIDKYFDYTFTVSSSDSDIVKINGYRAVVYRPLPGGTEKSVTLTISMQRKNTDNLVTKKLTFKVQPLSQAEIDKEIALMEQVKANYAAGILDGVDPTQVDKSLHAFKECYLDEGNNLVWIYNYSDCTGMGIEPSALPKDGYDESYNLFHSGEPTIIKHENLVLASIPKYDTVVTINSNLRSARFQKYAEKYPTDENFKKLVNQLVETTVTVKGSDGSENPNPEPPETEVTVKIKAQHAGAFLMAPQKTEVAYDLAERYGYTDTVKNHVSALDALVKEHELIFGKAFTKETKNEFLQVGSNGNVSVIFKVKASDNGFAINGKAPNDGIYNEIYQGYTGYTINQAQIKDNDLVDFFIYGDTAGYSDKYTWFDEGQEIETAANVPFDVSLKGFSFARYGMEEDSVLKQHIEKITGAQLAFVNEEGDITPIQNAVTDVNGKARLTLPEGTYSITAFRGGSSPLLLPFAKVTAVSGTTLQEKRAAAIDELSTYKDSSAYRQAQKKELQDAIEKGTLAINHAETFDQVKLALSNAKREIDAIKTDAQWLIEERIQKETEAYGIIYESLKAYKGGAPSEITITVPYSGTESEIQKNTVNLYLNVLFEHPELFYVKTEYKIEFDGKAAIITPSIIEAFNKRDSLIPAQSQFQEIVDSAVAACTSSEMTDLEKLLALHDWLVNHCQYNKGGYLSGSADTVNAYTAYGALVDADAVCQGYSLALGLMLQKAGVESYYVSGDGTPGHAWNVVKIDGNWYHVDSTWADSTPDRPGQVKHQYFLLSDKEIKDQDHHSKWSTRYGITCGQSYEGDTPWKSSTLPFVYDFKEKAFYNVENPSNLTQYRKVRFDAQGNAEVYGVQNLSLKNIAAQVEYKGILYLADNTGDVYAYDLKNKVKKLIWDESIGIDPGYGLLIRGEKLILRAHYEDEEELALYEAPSVSNEINKPSRVAAFLPAPGQFVNKTEMLYNAYPNPNVTLENPLSEKVVSLGAYGGYIVYEFDKPVTNSPNNPYGIDFIVYGNTTNGESEPGAVMVSKDGDTWYELAGSEYYNADTRKNLSITYTNPDPSFKGAVNIPWETSDKKTGYIYKNGTHTQAYYPNPKVYSTYNQGVGANSAYTDTTLSFTGNKINKDNVPAFGYADCHKTGSDHAAVNPYITNGASYNGDGMDLDWAIDQSGNPVKVDQIKYVKIYTAVLEDHGVMGESSSEVAGILAAQGKDATVGKTGQLKNLVINGQSISLTDNKYQYVYDATSAKSLVITATGESADNIFINNKRTPSGTASEPLALTHKVRIIVQNGQREPAIYMIDITGANIEDGSEAKLTNYLSDLIITKLPDKTVYKTGEALELTGIAVKGKYISDGAVVLRDIDTGLCTIEGFDNQQTGAQSVTISYYEDYYDTNHNFIKRIQTSAIFVAHVKDGKVETPEEKEQSVLLTIKGAKGKTWTSSRYVINPGVTSVMDALKAVLALNGTTYTIKAGDKYISSIDGLGEFDLGKNSGWMVTVDDYLIEVSAADWKLHGGEKILWFYTEDWTKVRGTKGWTQEAEQPVQPGAEETKTVVVTVKTEAKVDGQGVAKAFVNAADVNGALEKLSKESAIAEKQGITANKQIVLDIQSNSAANQVETTLSKAVLTAVNGKVDILKLVNPVGEITFDRNALNTMAKEAADVKVTIAKKDRESAIAKGQDLSDTAKKKIEKGIVLEVEVTAGGRSLTQAGGQVEIRIPYEKPATQKSEGIVAYELTSEGLMKPIYNGQLERDEKTFKLTTDHWATYILSYHDVNFADTQNHWADNTITYLAAREVIKGMTESTFEPDASMTRAQFVQILANMSNQDLTASKGTAFSDVNENAWFAKAAAWAAETGLVTGSINGNGEIYFNPNEYITRQDMAVLLSRYLSKVEQKKLTEVKAEVVFKDSDQVGSYASSAVKDLQKAGIINGRTADSFVPRGNATRAECAKMISTLMQNYL